MVDRPPSRLPTADELPDSDDTPVDNELQDLIPGLLKLLLSTIWADRQDWFWGTDMGFYFDPDDEPIVPDGLLALGVPRIKDENLRRSYVLWEEKVVPILTLEVVSRKRRNEYRQKKLDYAALGVRYYVIYNALRRVKESLEVYRLEQGEYVPMPGNPVWLAEIGLAIGCGRGVYQGIEREWLYWYDQAGERYLTPEERAVEARQQAAAAQQQAAAARQQALQEMSARQQAEAQLEALRRRLLSRGIDPDA
ncbi:Uma2 family endonuclease [Gloeobacter morelensis]|uniref:Uma2 family endonuclease n=1 Tax=Gloeobacter morelensis MG652769 TaxID=2781736 RepID=A0ABY3PRE9_9CYAN|nr:Uma2 family endonuclease [Gloeobacter morelensis]UFP96272.1 Uma2 family endonuclease [Gloeobacter morelensis MG652769]